MLLLDILKNFLSGAFSSLLEGGKLGIRRLRFGHGSFLLAIKKSFNQKKMLHA